MLQKRLHTNLYYGFANSVVISAYNSGNNFETTKNNEVYSVIFERTGTMIDLVTKCVYNPLLTHYIVLFPGCDKVIMMAK